MAKSVSGRDSTARAGSIAAPRHTQAVSSARRRGNEQRTRIKGIQDCKKFAANSEAPTEMGSSKTGDFSRVVPAECVQTVSGGVDELHLEVLCREVEVREAVSSFGISALVRLDIVEASAGRATNNKAGIVSRYAQMLEIVIVSGEVK